MRFERDSTDLILGVNGMTRSEIIKVFDIKEKK